METHDNLDTSRNEFVKWVDDLSKIVNAELSFLYSWTSI